jgi:hypothetical protein
MPSVEKIGLNLCPSCLPAPPATPRHDRLTEAAPKEQAEGFRQLPPAGQRLAAANGYHRTFTVEHWAIFLKHADLLHRPRRSLRRPHRGMAAHSQRPSGRRCAVGQIIDACLDGGFDPFSDELLFDHATFCRCILNPDMAPVVPVIINTLTPPMPTGALLAFGEFLGQALPREASR